MTFVKGQSGNPLGRTGEKAFTNELRAALNVVDPKTKRRKLTQVVETLVDKAIEGESWAVQMVSDRLDGKPSQENTLVIEKRDATDWTRTELVAFLNECRAGGNGIIEAGGSDSESDSVHRADVLSISDGTTSSKDRRTA